MRFGTYRGAVRTGYGEPIPVDLRGNPDIDAIISKMPRRQRGALYDTFRCDHAAAFPQEVKLFQKPMGPSRDGRERPRSPADTNMWYVGVIPPPFDFVMHSIRIVISPSIERSDYDHFVRSGSYRSVANSRQSPASGC